MTTPTPKSQWATDPTGGRPLVVASYTNEHSYTVEWLKASNGYVVRYGAQMTAFHCNESMAAAKEFGRCCHHAAECAGLLHENKEDTLELLRQMEMFAEGAQS